MNWLPAQFSLFQQSRITTVDCLVIHTDKGSGTVPRHFIVETSFTLYACDFIDLTYGLRQHLSFKKPFDILPQFCIRAFMFKRHPRLQIQVPSGH